MIHQLYTPNSDSPIVSLLKRTSLSMILIKVWINEYQGADLDLRFSLDFRKRKYKPLHLVAVVGRVIMGEFAHRDMFGQAYKYHPFYLNRESLTVPHRGPQFLHVLHTSPTPTLTQNFTLVANQTMNNSNTSLAFITKNSRESYQQCVHIHRHSIVRPCARITIAGTSYHTKALPL